MAFSRGFEAPAYTWAVEFDLWVKEKLVAGDWDALADWEKSGSMGELSVPTPDHYFPLLYTLGAAEAGETLSFPYEQVVSSLSMRCLRLG